MLNVMNLLKNTSRNDSVTKTNDKKVRFSGALASLGEINPTDGFDIGIISLAINGAGK